MTDVKNVKVANLKAKAKYLERAARASDAAVHANKKMVDDLGGPGQLYGDAIMASCSLWEAARDAWEVLAEEYEDK